MQFLRCLIAFTCLLIDSSIKWEGNFEREGLSMAKSAREKIKLKSTESTACYWTTKNKRTVSGRLELKKYDKQLKKHVIFKEAK